MSITPSNVYWLILPLVVAISLVYSASRHESWPRIWIHSLAAVPLDPGDPGRHDGPPAADQHAGLSDCGDASHRARPSS